MRKKKDLSLIYQCSLELFAEKGYKKTTLEDISNKLNMTNGNLYSYAKNKLELYQNTISFALTNWQRSVLSELSELKSTKEFLTKGCKVAISHLKNNQHLCAVIKNDLQICNLPKDIDPYRAIDNVTISKIKNFLAYGIAKNEIIDLDCDVFAELIFNAFKSIIYRTFLLNNDIIVLEGMDAFVEILVKGISV